LYLLTISGRPTAFLNLAGNAERASIKQIEDSLSGFIEDALTRAQEIGGRIRTANQDDRSFVQLQRL
jgi:hypothetical protein